MFGIREQFALDAAMEVVAVLAKLQPLRRNHQGFFGNGQRETHHERSITIYLSNPFETIHIYIYADAYISDLRQ